jgi:hypothetical protein
MSFTAAQKIADAVLYEGYVLYPYRASAAKNQVRWQFGIVAPREYNQSGGSDPWCMQTECLIDAGDGALIDIRLRFLQVQARTVEKKLDAGRDLFMPVESLEIDGRQFVTWEEGVEREYDLRRHRLGEILACETVVPFTVPASRALELLGNKAGETAGRVVRECLQVTGEIRLSATRAGSAVKLTVHVGNTTAWRGEFGLERNQALRHSLVSAHLLLGINGGKFLSLVDPPEWARALTASCVNENTWPVLVGEPDQADTVLAAPIILYDYPAVAPESPGDMCDATEIDEILTLRTMTLTEAEKQAARATDPRAQAIVDRADNIPGEVFERLHGALRYLRSAATKPVDEPKEVPWWEPGAQGSVSPESDSIMVNGVAVAKGSRVRLHPRRNADAQDMFLSGRDALVHAIFSDVDNKNYVAVTVAGDPAADLHDSYGRYFYFYPEEIEPLTDSSARFVSEDVDQ